MRGLISRLYPSIRPEEKAPVALLAFSLFLIIASYTICKSMRSSLVIQSMSANALPYIWALSVVVLSGFVCVYSKLVDRFKRSQMVVITSLIFVAFLIAIRWFMTEQSTVLSVLFYIWGDLFSVVMVEQFWSQCNEVFSQKDSKRLFGLIGTGATFGGLFGSWSVTEIVPAIGTLNAAYVAVGLILILTANANVVNFIIDRNGIAQSDEETALKEAQESSLSQFFEGFALLGKSRFLMFMAATLAMGQIVGALIDFQFSKAVEAAYPTLDGKSIFFGNFFMAVNAVSLFTLVFVMPVVFRYTSIIGGMMTHPIFVTAGTIGALVSGLPIMFFAMKLLDKSLSYSINRGAREMMYTSVPRNQKYKAKAVVDMLGWRFSKFLGALLIIPLSSVLGEKGLGAVSLVGLGVLFYFVYQLRNERKDSRTIEAEEEEARGIKRVRPSQVY